ncbi:MAG: hypothetical protein FJZ00_11125 [Candidatus Sericytochromatia bacterium]|uniref:Uncharacterized protein n=1 Tax=Candidatus Tanganyikabacteria bacterium TaxID=2961651 RepID=A0A937X441_9BACT|nr:hypothetical protein [Candidatus Tanganyikabacteria bacterium]
MHRTLVAFLLVICTVFAPFGRQALAAEGPTFIPYSFEPIWISLYDADTEKAFFPTKGVYEYEAKENLSGGYVTPPAGGLRGLPVTFFSNNGMFSEDYNRKVFALIRIKVTNQDTQRPSKVFDAGDFYLESLRGSVYRPHPFTVATTRRLAYQGDAVYMTLGFEVPPGVYTLVYKDVLPNGNRIQAEVWRYDININRGPLYAGIAVVLLAAAGVAAFIFTRPRQNS